MRTPRASARRMVRSMVASLPAWPPQATFADIMNPISSASCAASSSSPMSQFRSMTMGPLYQRVQPLLLNAKQIERPFHGDTLEADLLVGAQLAYPPEVSGDD